MLNAKQRSEIEQAIAGMRETLPRCWRQLFEGCVEEGFSKTEAMALVRTYVSTTIVNTTQPEELDK